MPKTIFFLPTWRCADCDYAQDFEPTEELMEAHFNMDENFVSALQRRVNEHIRQYKLGREQKRNIPKKVAAYTCPSCHLQGMAGKELHKESNPIKKSIVTVMAEEEVDTLTVLEKDEFGQNKYDTNGKKVYRLLNTAERQEKIKEIRDAITYWRAREDKD